MQAAMLQLTGQGRIVLTMGIAKRAAKAAAK